MNEEEAARVRTIFELYMQHQSMIATIKELDQRGWCNKRWTTRKGTARGGLPCAKTSLFRLLMNVTYIGKLKYKDEVHDGEHTAIVSPNFGSESSPCSSATDARAAHPSETSLARF